MPSRFVISLPVEDLRVAINAGANVIAGIGAKGGVL